LRHDPRNFGLERYLLFAVVRALAQHEGFDHGVQQIGGKLRIRNDDRFGRGFHLRRRPARQPRIQVAGEGIAIGLAERRRTAADIAAGAHRIHEVSHA
jgi:hypothetical protein